MKAGLYDQVLDHRGRSDRARAATNDKEYLTEGTEACLLLLQRLGNPGAAGVSSGLCCATTFSRIGKRLAEARVKSETK